MLTEILNYNFQSFIQKPKNGNAPQAFSEEIAEKVLRFHRQLPGYEPTRLISLKRLARTWGIEDIFVKDESTRFDLKAFKVLGGSYAVAQLICQKLGIRLAETDFPYLTSDEARQRIGRITLTTATDGNHGRGIAWAAQQLRQDAVIYMPKGTVPSRVETIRAHGAKVEVTDLNYDDAVRLANGMAEKNGWHMIQDTAWQGYEEIPLWIMQGYMTMGKETVDQMAAQKAAPTHVFVQAGVGSMSGAVVGYLVNRYRERPPAFIIMEPNNAACIFASAIAGDGRPHAVTGDLTTIMAGLACGEPNPMGWEILRNFTTGYVCCDNYVAANGIRILANPMGEDLPVEAGESGSVGIGLIDLLLNHRAFEKVKQALGIGPDSKLLFFNTEGATDPINYREILWYGKYPALHLPEP
ncbi:YgeX: putative diaminopropionate ammonia-lyase [Desulfosarcina variabilis str. Montpellier]|uniref:diaminopropionate ammonia-lyase n=1 Tax=Desulfosarcina variabilis TaxID=2300 RepID=UPI003AFB331C